MNTQELILELIKIIKGSYYSGKHDDIDYSDFRIIVNQIIKYLIDSLGDK